MKYRLVTLCLPFFMIVLSACASAAPTQIQSTEPPVADFHPLSTRTGVADVDAILAAVESGDPQQLRDLIRFTTVGCTKTDGLGGPPKCQDDEVEGTLVEVLPFLGSEGHFLRKADIMNFSGVNAVGVYAVYKVSNAAFSEDAYPAGEYAVVFISQENQPDIVVQIRAGIVRIDYLFPPISLGDVVQRDSTELILAP